MVLLLIFACPPSFISILISRWLRLNLDQSLYGHYALYLLILSYYLLLSCPNHHLTILTPPPLLPQLPPPLTDTSRSQSLPILTTALVPIIPQSSLPLCRSWGSDVLQYTAQLCSGSRKYNPLPIPIPPPLVSDVTLCSIEYLYSIEANYRAF